MSCWIPPRQRFDDAAKPPLVDIDSMGHALARAVTALTQGSCARTVFQSRGVCLVPAATPQGQIVTAQKALRR